MKRFGKLKLFGLVAFLTAALIFVGIDYLEGKKPPKWEWKVGIPDETQAETDECNLYGNPHGNPLGTPESSGYITYEKNDFVDVEYWTSEDKDTGEIHSIFSLKIENTEKGLSDGPGYYSIGFRYLQFIGCKSYCFLGGEGLCRSWVFPNSLYPGGVDCSAGGNCELINCCGPTNECGSDGYWVMKEFMETPAHPRNGYDHFSLRFWVNTDIEALDIGGESWEGEGYMWRLNIWNTSDILLTGSEKYHNIEPQWSVPLEGVEVYRSGENEWIITVDQCGVEDGCPPSQHGHSGRYIAFWETYYQGIEKQKGKSGKTYIDSEYRRALGAATPFKFITKWTRY